MRGATIANSIICWRILFVGTIHQNHCLSVTVVTDLIRPYENKLLNTVCSPFHFIPTRILGHLDNDDILFSAVGWL
jgi:hypothetical protein